LPNRIGRDSLGKLILKKDQPLTCRLDLCQRKKGGLILFLLFLLFFQVTDIGHPQSVFSAGKIPAPDQSQKTVRIAQSQKILEALLLEHRHRYREALAIWETLPQSSALVKDHVFQAELMGLKALNLKSVPDTVFSVKMAVSFLKWQKKWFEAYQLLHHHPHMVAQNEDLRTVQVILALYLRRYQEAESLLLGMSSHEFMEPAQRDLLWSWYFILSERKGDLKTKIDALEENALYFPASLMVMENLDSPWPEMKKRVLRALTRFPSDIELKEEVIGLLQNHGAWKELGTIIESKENNRNGSADWDIRANVYFQTGQSEKLKQLLDEIPEIEQQKIEYLDYKARVAILEGDWELLRRVSERCRKRYPYLQDGDLLLAEYEMHTGGQRGQRPPDKADD